MNNFSALDAAAQDASAAAKQETTRLGWSALVEQEQSGGHFCWRRGFDRGFGLDGRLLALQIGVPPFPFLSFIVLFTHKGSLHSGRIPVVWRTMMIRIGRFNTYLVLALAAAVAGVCGCSSTGDKIPKKLLTTLRLHLEASLNASTAGEPVPIYREKPVWVNVEKAPFLTEGNVSAASVIDVVGGFALRIQFDHGGTTLLETSTAANRGRRIGIFCQFGDEIKDYRWLAAPVISHRISDGVLVFTPDATREEADEIALGLNNVSKKVHTWIDR